VDPICTAIQAQTLPQSIQKYNSPTATAYSLFYQPTVESFYSRPGCVPIGLNVTSGDISIKFFYILDLRSVTQSTEGNFISHHDSRHITVNTNKHNSPILHNDISQFCHFLFASSEILGSYNNYCMKQYLPGLNTGD